MKYYTLENCHQATGTVVVIDVIRAFTTAAIAFEAGAKTIRLVGEIGEAFQIRELNPQVRLMGEDKGLKIAGFNYGNSPAEIAGEDLSDIELVHRTSAGTQGVIRARSASVLLTASFCCANATVRYLKKLKAKSVSFVITGITGDGRGDEDTACADYLSRLLNGENVRPESYLDRVRNSVNARILAEDPISSPEDLDYCCALDRVNFAMRVEKTDEGLILKKIVMI